MSTHDSLGRLMAVPVESCSLAIAYNSDGTINTVTATDPSNSNVYIQTFTYTTGSPTAVSGWVKQ